MLEHFRLFPLENELFDVEDLRARLASAGPHILILDGGDLKTAGSVFEPTFACVVCYDDQQAKRIAEWLRGGNDLAKYAYCVAYMTVKPDKIYADIAAPLDARRNLAEHLIPYLKLTRFRATTEGQEMPQEVVERPELLFE
jgi:hypothetical protein